MPRSLVLLAAVLAGHTLSAPAIAGDMLTLRQYRDGQAAGGDAAAVADRYVDGALHGILMVDEALKSGGSAMFCLDDAHLVDGAPDLDRIRGEFTAWLEDARTSGADLAETQSAPMTMFAFGFFAQKFPCGGAAEGAEGTLDSVLRRALPQ
jgi:hypothetical protein